MEEKITQLLEGLAIQLGTTTEYLWSVLVKQAYVAAISGTIQVILLSLFTFALYRVSIGTYHKVNPDKGMGWEEIIYIPLIIVGVVVAVVWLCFLQQYPDLLMSAIFNPEYWALNHILEAINE